MAEKQETIADIIAEMKRRKGMLEDAAFNAPLCYSTETMRAQYEILDEFVERLEAAHKREVDALEQQLNDAISEEQRRKMATKEAEIVRPRRNCDVGTAEEQQARHCAWCRKHGIDGDNKVNCAHPDMSCDLCTLRWAQMPYKEAQGGGAK